MNTFIKLYTILYFGANLISLYLFRVKIGGKVACNLVFYSKYPQK